jgi:tRNA-2-methylthio-N6-dimethylallyladenosine synthase
MRRGYTRERYMKLIDKLRDIRPDIAITSDVMVGFPGETKKDFEDTIDLIKRVEFDTLYSFRYSDRPGTSAEKMKDKVNEKEKIERLIKLQSVQKQITLKKNKSLENKEVEVLVEGFSKKGGQFTGRTPTNKIVNFQSDINLIGHLVKVKIRQGYANSLMGVYIKNVR